MSGPIQTAQDECGFYGAPYGPAGEAYDPATAEVYVADSETNAVYVISTLSLTVVRTISLGATCVNPFGIAYDPATGDVLVAETGGRAIAVVSDINNSVVSTIPVSGAPWNLAVDSSQGLVYSTEPLQGNVSVVSLETGTQIATVDIGISEQPTGIIYAPAFNEVFVANDLGETDTVSVIATATDSLAATIPINCDGTPPSTIENPLGIAFDPFTDLVLVSCLVSAGIGALTPYGYEQLTHFNVGSVTGISFLAFDNSTQLLWAADPFDDLVLAISDPTGSVVARGNAGGFPFEGLAIDDRTGNVYVSNWKAGNVTVLAGNAAWVATITLPVPTSTPVPVPFSPSPQLVLLVAAVSLIVVLATVGLLVWSRKPSWPFR